jgi:heat shock protein HtpX
MERRTGRDLGLALRMGAALVLLAFLYFPLPVACVMVVLGLTHSWLLAAGTLAVVGLGVCYLPALSERIALSSANATELAEDEEPELRALVGRLAAMADLPAPRLALSPTDVPNAFAAGRSPRDAVIVVTRGLLRRLGREELEAVLAHELTHVASREAFVMTLIGAPAMLGKRIFDAIIRAPGRVQTPGKIVLFFVFLYLLFPLFFGWVLYALATALVRTVSRYREFVADRGSVLLTGEPEALQSALQRLAGELPLIPKEDLRQVAGANALFIVPVAAEGVASALDPQRIFGSHPPLEQRLARLRQLAQEVGRSVQAERNSFFEGKRPPLRANPSAPRLLLRRGLLVLRRLVLARQRPVQSLAPGRGGLDRRRRARDSGRGPGLRRRLRHGLRRRSARAPRRPLDPGDRRFLRGLPTWKRRRRAVLEPQTSSIWAR